MKALRRFATGSSAHKYLYTVHFQELTAIHKSLANANLAVFWRRRAESGVTPSHQVKPSPDGTYRHIFFGHMAKFPATLFKRDDGFEEKVLELKLKQVSRDGSATIAKTTYDVATCTTGTTGPTKELTIEFRKGDTLLGRLKVRINAELRSEGNASDMSESNAASITDNDTSIASIDGDEDDFEDDLDEPPIPAEFGKPNHPRAAAAPGEGGGEQSRRARARDRSNGAGGDLSKLSASQLRERLEREQHTGAKRLTARDAAVGIWEQRMSELLSQLDRSQRELLSQLAQKH